LNPNNIIKRLVLQDCVTFERKGW